MCEIYDVSVYFGECLNWLVIGVFVVVVVVMLIGVVFIVCLIICLVEVVWCVFEWVVGGDLIVYVEVFLKDEIGDMVVLVNIVVKVLN